MTDPETSAQLSDRESRLEARCFEPAAARSLAGLGVTPNQASLRTRDGHGDYIDTIGYKVASGDLTARQGAARSMSSR